MNVSHRQDQCEAGQATVQEQHRQTPLEAVASLPAHQPQLAHLRSEGQFGPHARSFIHIYISNCMYFMSSADMATGSWIDIASGQSSASLSSANEEIITTGLRVQHDAIINRRRRARSTGQFVIGTGYRATSGGNTSSQEEYEESESESDRVMTSSNEGVGPSPLQNEYRRPSQRLYSSTSSETMSEREGDDDEDDDDENLTAVNYPRSSRRPFEPRPNAFSHPPAAQAYRPQAGANYPTRRPAARTSSQRHSFPQHSPSPYGAMSPQQQADHDEALRASLSTILSAAAAVRGLPKAGQARPETAPSSNRVNPSSLRLVPESVALGDATTDTASSRVPSTCPTEGSKRKSGPQTHARSSSKDRRVIKRARIDDISPTLFTWVVSAGVVVLVSALSFSAGYMAGKEVGHAEAMGQLGSVGSDTSRCSKEVVSGVGKTGMGLRRLRWGGGAGIRA